MLDDVVEFIFELALDGIVATPDIVATKHKIEGIVGFLLGILLCICVWLIFEGINIGNVMLVVLSSVLLIALLSIFVVITINQKKK